jgi:hypothetical protein
MVFLPFVRAAGVELEDGVLWYKASSVTEGYAVDR